MKTINVVILLLILLVFWKLFIPVPKVAGDFQIIHPENLKMNFDLPQAWVSKWSEGLGEYNVGTLWSWPLDFLYGLGGILGVNFWVLELILGILPAIILSFWSMGRLLKFLGISGWGNLTGRLFYVLNTYFLLLIDGGQLNLALAYSILPFAFVLFKKATDRDPFRSSVKFALSAAAISFTDIRILIFLILLAILDFFFFPKKIIGNFGRYLLIGTVTSLILLFLHAYWIVPSFLNQPPSLPSTYSRPDQLLNLSFANIGHALTLLQPHWYQNIFGKVSGLNFEFVVISVIVFLAPILKRGDKKVAFWLFVSLTGVFLAKGVNPPFGGINIWLFTNVPGFSFFRDPTKFFFLICLGYSVLLATVVSQIPKKWLNLLLIAIFVYIFWLVRPVYLGQMTGILGTQLYQKEYSLLTNFLNSDRQFSRVLWIPTKPPLGFSSPSHLSVEASRFAGKRPFATGTIGTYETFNFLREASFSGQLMDVAGVGFIVYPYPDLKRDDLSFDKIRYYYTFNGQLANLPWLSREKDVEIPTYQVKKHQDEIFIVPNIWWVIGSDDIYEKLADSKIDLSRNALIFADETPGLSERLSQLPEAKIILNKKGLVDLAASFIKSDYLISPAAKLDFQPNESGWWKREAADLVWWKSFLREKYGINNQDFDLKMGWAVGEGSLKLKVKSEKFKKGEVLLARVMESTRSGSLRFYQDNHLIGQVNTGKAGDIVRWFEVGLLGSSDPVLIQASGEINVINVLAVLKKDLWDSFKVKVEELKNAVRIQDLSDRGDSEKVKVKFRKINATSYQVSVTNLTKPSLLILSQSFNGLWKLESQYSYPVYSLLNGFRIEKDGTYQIKFEPQQTLEQGFTVSLLTLIFLSIYLFMMRNKR